MLLKYLFNRFYFAAGDSLRDTRPFLHESWSYLLRMLHIGYDPTHSFVTHQNRLDPSPITKTVPHLSTLRL
jgi:hypothetical protein